MSAAISESLAEVARRESADRPEAIDSPGVLRVGSRIGHLTVTRIASACIEIRSAGELGFARVLIGLVPILWCAAAWARCLREGWINERWQSCIILSAIALMSAVMLMQCGPKCWRFTRGRGVRIRAGCLPLPVLWRRISNRRLSNLQIENLPAARFAGLRLRVCLMNNKREPIMEIARWPRAEIDRSQVEVLGTAVRKVMGW